MNLYYASLFLIIILILGGGAWAIITADRLQALKSAVTDADDSISTQLERRAGLMQSIAITLEEHDDADNADADNTDPALITLISDASESCSVLRTASTISDKTNAYMMSVGVARRLCAAVDDHTEQQDASGEVPSDLIITRDSLVLTGETITGLMRVRHTAASRLNKSASRFPARLIAGSAGVTPVSVIDSDSLDTVRGEISGESANDDTGENK